MESEAEKVGNTWLPARHLPNVGDGKVEKTLLSLEGISPMYELFRLKLEKKCIVVKIVRNTRK